MHFFVHALSKPVHWIVFVVMPAAAIVALHLVLDYTGTGLLLFAAMLQAGVIASLSLREKEVGIYHRILAAPVSATVYSVSLFIAVFLVLTLEVTLVLCVTVLLVPGPFGVGFAELYLVVLVFAAMAAAFGIMLTSFASTHTQGTVLTNVSVIFTSMVSGCFWPLAIMPDYMQTIAKALPQTWANLALAELANGARISEVWIYLLVLLLYGVTFLLVFGLQRRRAA
jgi:ABC-2 type transport system permease protein